MKIDIPTKYGVCDSYVAYPHDGKKHPAVMLMMDAFGPRAYLYSMADKLASHGFFVLLPNLFYRIRHAPVIDSTFPIDKSHMPEARKELTQIYNQYRPKEGLEDIAEFLKFLSHEKQVKPGKIGITGYCMGGGMGLRAAAAFPDSIAAVASFHGGSLATDRDDSPHLGLNKIKAKIYIAHADYDGSMPPEQMDRLKIAMENAGNDFESELYVNAHHGFTMADLPVYEHAALEKHWIKLLELFKVL